MKKIFSITLILFVALFYSNKLTAKDLNNRKDIRIENVKVNRHDD